MLLTCIFMWCVSLSFRIIELRSEGTCGGYLVHCPAQGMGNLRGSGPCAVLHRWSLHSHSRAFAAVLSHSHGEDFFRCAQSELPVVLSLHTSWEVYFCLLCNCSLGGRKLHLGSLQPISFNLQTNPVLLVSAHVTCRSPLATGDGCLWTSSSLSFSLLYWIPKLDTVFQ